MSDFEYWFNFWNTFVHDLSYKNRFFVDSNVISTFINIFEESTMTLPIGKIIYRSRIYSPSGSIRAVDIEKKISEYDYLHKINLDKLRKNEKMFVEDDRMQFWGFNAEESHVNKNNDQIQHGRINPEKISVLYASNDTITSVAETRAKLMDLLSVSELKVNQPLHLVDLTYNSITKVNEIYKPLAYIIFDHFRRPNNKNHFDYLPTQFLGEFIKNQNFDGIAFNSSLSEFGVNYAIFNHEKCHSLNSSIYELRDVCYDLRCLDPIPGENIFSKKLIPYYLKK